MSTLGLGRGSRVPSSRRLYCMKTRFQSSNQRSQSQAPMAQTGASHRCSSPRSKTISLQGPQGPVSPISQKLSFRPSPTIRSGGRPAISCQSSKASRSSSSPSRKIVTQSRSFGSSKTSVRSSQA